MQEKNDMNPAIKRHSVWLCLTEKDPKKTAVLILNAMGKKYTLELGMYLTLIAPNGPEILDSTEFFWPDGWRDNTDEE